jgi:hypothetical protein
MGGRLLELVPGCAAPLLVAGMVAIATMSLPATRAWGAVAVRQEPSGGPTQAVPAAEGRGFSHGVHRGVQCTSCHMSAGGHGVLKVRTREDCLACHHASTDAGACVRCHAASSFPSAAGKTVEVRTSLAPEASRRILPFAHSFHGSVSCGDCHGPAPTFRPPKACSSCHDRHHTEARDCQKCHPAQAVKSHPAMQSHAGCASAGCHVDKAVAALSWSRNVCVACHQDHARHEAGRDCAVCHQVPALHTTRTEVTP